MSAPRDQADLATLTLESWQLAYEAGWVMWLRGMRIMAGGKLAERETQRMFSEKWVAGATLWPALMMGGAAQSGADLGQRAVRHYGKPVRANRRRLAR